MLPLNVALVSEVPDVEISELNRVAAAIQKTDNTRLWPYLNVQSKSVSIRASRGYSG